MSLVERLEALIELVSSREIPSEIEDELHYILNSFEQQLEEE